MASLGQYTAADVLIIGGGPTGGVLGLALAQAGLKVIVAEKTSPSHLLNNKDLRGFALSSSSCKLLDAVGLWHDLSSVAEPILNVKVSQGHQPKSLRFLYEEQGENLPMGYIVEGYELRSCIARHLQNQPFLKIIPSPLETWELEGQNILASFQDGTKVRAPLIIGADGRTSQVRQKSGIPVVSWPYAQKAIVCAIHHKNDHKGIAYEKFLETGPFAALPMTQQRSSIVWTERSQVIDLLVGFNEEDFNKALSDNLGGNYEDVRCISKRQSFPLSVQFAETYVLPRIALIGDAAHVMHPLAGQGLNMGLRDVAALAEVLVDAARLGLDLGQITILEKYQQWRRFDNLSMIAFTDGINRLFTNNSVTLRKLRGLGLKAVDHFTFLKNLSARHAMGMVGNLPKLLKGQPL
jgi:2-octaprenyl-6-methoxyphenol hydroxylase